MYTKTKQCKASHILYKYHDIFSLFFPVWEKVVRKYCENSVIFSDISKEFVKSSIFLFFSNRLIWEKSYFLQIFEKKKVLQKMKIYDIFSLFFPVLEKFCHFTHPNDHFFSNGPIIRRFENKNAYFRKFGLIFCWENGFFQLRKFSPNVLISQIGKC